MVGPEHCRTRSLPEESVKTWANLDSTLKKWVLLGPTCLEQEKYRLPDFKEPGVLILL